MHPILQSALGSIIRYALVYLSAFLVKHGIWSESEAQAYVAAGALALLAIAWSVFEKYRSRVKFLTALLPENKTENDVKEHIALGVPTPSVRTSPDAVPIPNFPK